MKILRMIRCILLDSHIWTPSIRVPGSMTCTRCGMRRRDKAAGPR